MEKVIQESIKAYMNSHSRSNKKLIILHKYISNCILQNLNSDFTVHSLPDKEINVVGRYNNKKVDICIKNNGNPCGIVSVKFIMSNYQQNANNYFENCCGEMLNLHKNVKTMYVMIIFDDIPYYNNLHEIKSYYNIQKPDILRYEKLVEDQYINSLIIINVSNGKQLTHPEKISKESLKKMDYSVFRIQERSYDFKKSIKKFAQMFIKK